MILRSMFARIVRLLGILFPFYGALGSPVTWEVIHSREGEPTLHAIAAGGSRLVAVGESGAIWFSDNQTEWTRLPVPSGNNLHGIAHGADRFIAVGEQGSIIQSPDGKSWDEVTLMDVAETLWSVAFNRGVFVAVGDNGVILKSSDGIDWERRPHAIDTTLWSVTSSPQEWTFIALGDAGTVLRSADGENWHLHVPSQIEANDYVGVSEFAQPAAYHYLSRQGRGALERFTEQQPANGSVWSTAAYGELGGGVVGPINGAITTPGGGFAFGPGGGIFHETIANAIRYWWRTPSPTTVDLHGAVVAQDRLFLVGEEGTILRSRKLRPGRLLNLSTRGMVQGNTQTLIAGFVISGERPQTCLIRGIGPALAAFDVDSPLDQPRLRVFDDKGRLIAENTGWGQGESPGEIAELAMELGAFELPTESADCAVTVELSPGVYTAEVAGVTEPEGIALIEIYQRPDPESPNRSLVNLSTRGWVGNQEGALMIGGFTIEGDAPRRLLVRGVGPSLSAYGVTDSLPMPDVRVTADGFIFHGTPGPWSRPNSGPDRFRAAATRSGAFPLQEGSTDRVIILDLIPGHWTVHLSSETSRQGNALVEIYDITD